MVLSNSEGLSAIDSCQHCNNWTQYIIIIIIIITLCLMLHFRVFVLFFVVYVYLCWLRNEEVLLRVNE